MSRKEHYINQINHKDETLLNILKNCQHISQEQALLIVSRSRLDNFCKEGVLAKVHYIDSGRQASAYELTHKGRKFISQKLPHLVTGGFYQSRTAVKHNIALAGQIMEHSQSRWINERELREMMAERIVDAEDLRWHYMRMLENHQISPTDGAFINEQGEICLVEIINDNYGTEQIAAKEAFAEVMNASIQFIRQ